MRMKRAIGEMVVNGVETTLPLHMRLVENADIQAGDYDIHWLEHFLADNKIAPAPAAASKTTHKPRKA
jgi:acetyl-CoA carboxylase biotin carboxylase subunit